MEIIIKKESKKSSDATKESSTFIEFCVKTTTQSKKSNQKPSINLLKSSKEIQKLVEESVEDGHYSADLNETLFFRNAQINGYKHVMVVSLGEDSKASNETLRKVGASIEKTLVKNKTSIASINLDGLVAKFGKDVTDAVSAAVQGLLLSDYEFDKYKNKDTKSKLHPVKKIYLVATAQTKTSLVEKGLEEGIILSECINFSRSLGDTPGNLMFPEQLGKEAQTAAKGTGMKVTVWDSARIKKEKMGGLFGVGQGSDHGPRFIIMEYKGAAASKKPICFVGKGLTFDAGGISIKPSAAMDEMKYDMCGGANVIGTMLAIAKLKLNINAIAYIPAAENLLGPSATKPGDILTARNGKTVEVLNTDAEGRLILMDALSYASEQKPALIIDAATLTGAMVIALHNVYTGFFTRDKKLKEKVEECAKKTGERVWQLPMHDDHTSDMKGRHADLQNISNHRGAGSSTAAAFLGQFVSKDIPWAHFDIAGTAWDLGNRFNYCPARGASGVMIRTFVELAKSY